jgi:chromatin structure-remodeling complex subunit RSC9
VVIHSDIHRAYEITTHWKEIPPPKEILEDISARGGDLRTRTLENYTPRAPREQENLLNGDKSDGSDDEAKTPKADKMEVDDPGSHGGRATRGKTALKNVLICLLTA